MAWFEDRGAGVIYGVCIATLMRAAAVEIEGLRAQHPDGRAAALTVTSAIELAQRLGFYVDASRLVDLRQQQRFAGDLAPDQQGRAENALREAEKQRDRCQADAEAHIAELARGST